MAPQPVRRSTLLVIVFPVIAVLGECGKGRDTCINRNGVSGTIAAAGAEHALLQVKRSRWWWNFPEVWKPSQSGCDTHPPVQSGEPIQGGYHAHPPVESGEPCHGGYDAHPPVESGEPSQGGRHAHPPVESGEPSQGGYNAHPPVESGEPSRGGYHAHPPVESGEPSQGGYHAHPPVESGESGQGGYDAHPPVESGDSGDDSAGPHQPPEIDYTDADSGGSDCLCVFDIDRTLTGKQGDTQACPHNQVVGMHDEGYGGGPATLSALAAAGLNSTFCDECHLGITSAGAGSGADSEWNHYLLDHVMRGKKQDSFASRHPLLTSRWSYGTQVQSPYVLQQGNKVKQIAVEEIRQWYGHQGVKINPEDVYFFGDRTENIEPFKTRGFNSKEISCGSRDPTLYQGSGMVGYCGATPGEIKKERGNYLCAEA